jgi:anti-sigma regulatory factor (Ser/Thr protein kinase)
MAVRLPHDPTSAWTSRRIVERGLAGFDVPPQRLDDALIVVSELVGNAVRHARALADGCIELVWRLVENRLEIEVSDGGPDRTREVQPLRASDEAGRGLCLVTALSEDVVVERDAHHSRTRAVLLVA